MIDILKKILTEAEYQKMFSILKRRQINLLEFLSESIRKNLK